MALTTVEKEVDGEPTEVEISEDDLPDGTRVLSDDQIGPSGDYVRKDYFEQEMQRRTSGKIDREEASEQLLSDEDHVQRVLEEHGTDDERVQRLQTEKEKLENELTEYQEKLQTFDQRDRQQTIEQAARAADIDERFLDAPDGTRPPIHAMLEGRTERTDDGDLVPLDSDGNRIPAPSDEDRTYATIADYFERDAWDDYRAEQEKTTGSGFAGSGTGRSKAWSDLSPEERSEMSTTEKVKAMEADPEIST